MAEKIGMFARIRIFYGEVRTEMSKVVWPTAEQTRTYTGVVIVTTIILSSVIGVWDLGLSYVLRFVFNLHS